MCILCTKKMTFFMGMFECILFFLHEMYESKFDMILPYSTERVCEFVCVHYT